VKTEYLTSIMVSAKRLSLPFATGCFVAMFGLSILCSNATAEVNDPCGMVPPIYTGKDRPISRIGLQQTYVFYKDGVETFVIRPGFTGKVDEFGMLIPFPTPPALRKVSDNTFPQIANAIDPPEVVIDLRPPMRGFGGGGFGGGAGGAAPMNFALAAKEEKVVVLNEEAVGMYEVAVLEAGSARALKRWMDEHGYMFPKGMDKVCNEYVAIGWCFVAVKTKVGQKAGADPKSGQRATNTQLPKGSVFDGHVQGMGFRFKSKELVVPMRLSAFNEGDTRNVVYLLTDDPKKIRSIPEEFVQRQISGRDLIANVTKPLPLRILNGALKDLQPHHKKTLPQQRNPEPKNGVAKNMFAADLQAVMEKQLSLPHEEAEKELLRIGEHFGLRGPEIDDANAQSLKSQSDKVAEKSLKFLEDMTLTVVDGDFPRNVLARDNLRFASYRMPSRRNNPRNYDSKVNGPTGSKSGVLVIGAIDWSKLDTSRKTERYVSAPKIMTIFGVLAAAACLGLVFFRSRRRLKKILTRAVVGLAFCGAGFVGTSESGAHHNDPCGMVPPIYTGNASPISRIGLQQTYVFYKDGIETFVIRPGFSGKVDEFGMLIPFPSPPAIRKVADNVFPQIANSVDPPEVVVRVIDARWQNKMAFGAEMQQSDLQFAQMDGKKKEVVVLKQEAVGMYEVAVLEAGSAAALKRWMDKHGYQYPEGMDKVANEYIESDWCFVAVKTKVGQKGGADPKSGQRAAKTKLPSGSVFDGHVQGMGFRFKTEELVVPMRLSTFNEGDTRNVVYLLTDAPKKIRSIPEEFVQRQISGKQLIANITQPLPLRIIGGTEKDLQEWHKRNLPQQRNPDPHMAVAKQLYASDIHSVASGELSLAHEEDEKELLRIGEHFGLRGPEIDKANSLATKEKSDKTVAASLKDLQPMTLTVIDGNFPREVLAGQNLTFAQYKMPSRRNNNGNYDPKTNSPAEKKDGILKIGSIDWSHLDASPEQRIAENWKWTGAGLVGLLAIFGLSLMRIRKPLLLVFLMIATATVAILSTADISEANNHTTVNRHLDPCGMVPPIYTGPGKAITRVGLQQTYVFYKDGVETFVIRPGFTGKVDQFGMLIPFPSSPELRKVPDNVFEQIANAVDPPEVVIDLMPMVMENSAAPAAPSGGGGGGGLRFRRDRNKVTVLKKEAVGMYEVAVLEAGSAKALKKWMDKHGYQYPKGMDKVCEEYVEIGWCFVAVKTKVGQKAGVDPQAGQKKIDSKLPTESVFDGSVQGMGFRFKSDELVVPMRLSAFNDGDTRNVVYLLTDSPKKIRSIPEEFVQRQLTGKQLISHLTDPLPLRILNGTEKDLTDWHKKNLPKQRNPEPKNGVAKQLFTADLVAISSGNLSLPHEETEKEFLRIGEHFGLRGPQIDAANAKAIKVESDAVVKKSLKDLESMTLTVVDGDFPRQVLSKQNLTFAQYKMPSRRNTPQNYDAKLNAPSKKKAGRLIIGAIDWNESDVSERPSKTRWAGSAVIGMLGLFLAIGLVFSRRLKTALMATVIFSILGTTAAFANHNGLTIHSDPCGMVPPIYAGGGAPISRIGLQQTYVFYKDGVETFVIRPGFTGKVEEFGMLIPFPSPPAIRKVADDVFPQIANAVDPPEVVVDLRYRRRMRFDRGGAVTDKLMVKSESTSSKDSVRVIKQEAVGMYEVAVLEAGSAKALQRWMDQHSYQYPKGMDKVANEYIESKWCFVAVKTKVGQRKGADPRAGQRKANTVMPQGSTFDGHVQGMGFRFESDELVVPMRLSTFNEGDTRNVVYLLTDSPKKIRSIPEEFVQRQISGKQLIANCSQPLPLRIIGGTEKDLEKWHRESLPKQRNPKPKNGIAKQLFTADLHAISIGQLSLEHEEDEKELLRIGEFLGLRGKEIDAANADAIAEKAETVTESALADLESMTLSVVDGDFPREVLAGQNLTFAQYKMPSRRNNSLNYDPKTNKAGSKKEGVLKIGAIDWSHLDQKQLEIQNKQRYANYRSLLPIGLCLLVGMIFTAAFAKRRLRSRN